MAYDASTDYASLKKSLQSQLDATTDPTQRAQIQSQIDAAEQSRIEKSASNLSKYGKYLDSGELDSAAGIIATNSVGTGYETEKANLNKSYAQASQNASNDALSRGMARSSYVSDRLATLDSNKADALASVDQAKANAIQNAKTSILDTYQTNQANQLTQDKQDFRNNIMAYYGDYQAQINNVQNDGDTSNDWQIPILQAARQQKLLDQQQAAAKVATSGGSSGGGSGGASAGQLSYSQLASALDKMNTNNLVDGYLSDAGKQQMYNFLSQYGGKYAGQFMAMYGLTAPKSATINGNYSAVYGQASTMIANGGTEDDVANYIADRQSKGQISSSEALAIARALGLNI